MQTHTPQSEPPPSEESAAACVKAAVTAQKRARGLDLLGNADEEMLARMWRARQQQMGNSEAAIDEELRSAL